MTLPAFAGEIAQDARYAFRTMTGRPVFTIMAVLSLALGIGANTAIYSFMDSILMRSLPVQDPSSLVVVNWHSKDHPAVANSFSGSTYKDATWGYTSGNFPYAAYELISTNHEAFSHVFGFSGAGRLNVQIRGSADLAAGQYVTGGFFAGLGVVPAAGRLIDQTDDREGAAPVVVVSHGYAQRHFGDPAKAAGQSFVLNWRFTDRDETLALSLKHCTITHRMGDWSPVAAASITTTRATLDDLVLGKTTAPEALGSGALKVEGDASRFALLFAMLDQPANMMFDILTPGEGRP